jgi:hypothetical protein
MQKGNGLSGSFILESPPYENLDEPFPANHQENIEDASRTIFYKV